MPTPRLADRVHYLDPGLAGTNRHRNGGTMRAAIITATADASAEDGRARLEGDRVHLWVYTPTIHGGFPAFDVPRGESPDGTIPPGTWTETEKG